MNSVTYIIYFTPWVFQNMEIFHLYCTAFPFEIFLTFYFAFEFFITLLLLPDFNLLDHVNHLISAQFLLLILSTVKYFSWHFHVHT